MNALTRFELRKLIRRKTALIGLLGLLLVGFLSILVPAFMEESYDSNGEVKGFAAISLDKHYAQAHSGELTPALLKEVITRYQEIRNNPAYIGVFDGDAGKKSLTNEGFYATYPDDFVMDFIRSGYSPATGYDYYIIDQLAPSDAEHFYERRDARVESYLTMDYTYGNYSEKDKAFFKAMNARISTPMKLEYTNGWNAILQGSGSYFLVAAFVLSVCAAPVFSSEYQTGADSIVLSTRHGRGKVIHAKLRASLLFSSGMFLLGWFASLGLALAIYGPSGWDSPLQTLDTRLLFSPFPVSVLGAFLLATLIGLLACLLVVSFTLLLSSRLRSPFPVIVWSILLLISPLFVSYSKQSRLFNHILDLMPGKQTEVFETFRNYEVYHLFGWNLYQPYAMGVASLLVAILLLPFAYRGFRKHEVA
ncbi:hypothetical protein [Gorillibacterium sp. CAU 1737]|uniref:hypothetical protein n=1 Tax=Gorillibacterium sp. CAU 1737 TaxID=3140362 RepID=UPI0032612C06